MTINSKARPGKSSALIKKNLVTACRILSHEGLVHGFGHMSARIPQSDLFILTPRISLALVEERDLIVLNLKGELVKGKAAPPFETPLHTAIFNGRGEIHAIYSPYPWP